MFGFNKKIFTGIDIGTSSIKIVELTIKNNRPVLSNYVWVHLDDSAVKSELKPIYFDTILPEYIKKMLKEASMSRGESYFSIPSFGGLITLIEFPNMATEELDQAIRFEAHKYIPISLDDVVLSWDIVNRKNSKKLVIRDEEVAEKKADVAGNKIEVLLVAAPKNKVIKYEKLAKDVKIKLKAIEIESFSLTRALVGNDMGNFIIVDIGSRVCNIILVEKGIIKANRNIDAGGKDISRIIARSMNVSETKADALKVSGKNFLDNESGMNFPVIDSIVGEINRVVSSYYKGKAVSIDSIILSGGTAGLAGITEYLSKAVGIKAIMGNPIGRIEYDKRIESEIKNIGNQFSVAIGLALNGVDEYLKK